MKTTASEREYKAYLEELKFYRLSKADMSFRDYKEQVAAERLMAIITKDPPKK